MRYRFGDFTLNDSARTLYQGDLEVGIEPMVFDCLVLLIKNGHRVVLRDELVEVVWKGRFVSDATVSSRIKSARQAIGDDGRAQGLIRTLHGRGFRFTGEVTELTDETSEPGSGQRQPGQESGAAARPSVGIATEGDSEIGSYADLDLRPPSGPSIAVLPLRIVGDPEGREVFAEGLANDLVTRLGRTRSMFVTSRRSAFRFRGPDLDVAAVAARLGVRYILTGSVQFAGDRLRITVVLSDTSRQEEIWVEAYDRRCEDVLTLQIDIAEEVVAAVESEVMRGERQRAILTNPSNLDAWTAYHRACWHMFSFRRDGLDEADRFFQLAARLDPSIARVQAGLSFVHWQRAFLELTADRDEEISRAVEHANQSVSLDPRDPLARMSMGRALLLKTERYDEALVELEHAVKLNPSSALAQYSVGYGCMLTVEPEKGESPLLAARRLSPYDMMSFAMLGAQSFNAAITGRHADAVAYSMRAAGQPNVHDHALAIVSFCTAKAGRTDLALGNLGRLAERRPDYRISDVLRAFPFRDPDIRREVGAVLAKLGLVA